MTLILAERTAGGDSQYSRGYTDNVIRISAAGLRRARDAHS